ncbi:MAG TPA: hydrogenase maturation protease [Thermoplasmata archaeon]|nr:hydrogenase maturation protease [Thermoplasmata archaeon]HLA46382.1 hydrogenase maturation protease [Thermoplasmata archaeon]
MTRVVGPLERELGTRLRDAYRIAIIGIGDELNPVDRLGVLAAREIEALGFPGVRVFLAGTLPESFTGPVRRTRPDAVLLLDAADMGLRPGTVLVIGAANIQGSRLSTHALPLSVVMEFLRKTVRTRVILVGLQPDLRSRSRDPSPAEEAGLTHVVTVLHRILARRVPPVNPLPSGGRWPTRAPRARGAASISRRPRTGLPRSRSR